VVQGLGAALFEKCIYDERGQLTNANMADYLVPMSGEMPDIDVGHVVSPTLETELGAKGAGEAGTAGAAAAVANAVNDALSRSARYYRDSADAAGYPDGAWANLSGTANKTKYE
jgi:CO/xanthine dehydrogenase Mo-binding subunit